LFVTARESNLLFFRLVENWCAVRTTGLASITTLPYEACYWYFIRLQIQQ